MDNAFAEMDGMIYLENVINALKIPNGMEPIAKATFQRTSGA